MSETVAEINRQLEKDKAAFNLARMKIASALAPALAKQGAEEIFIAHAFENGVDFTIDDAKRNPGYFDLTHAPDHSVSTKLTTALKEADAVNTRIIDLVAQRENMLMAQDPDHKPSYFWMGREFTIDPKNQTQTFHDTRETVAFVREERPSPSPASTKERSR